MSSTKNITEDFLNVVRKLPNFEYREQQLQMVETISRAIETGTHAVIEAGTGSGKSFAYLYPVISMLDKIKKPVVISTGTIALQEQLLEKDIPFMKQCGFKNFEAVIAKGRNNYLCKQKLMELERITFRGTPVRMEVDFIVKELDTWDGDFANLSFAVTPDLKREIESLSEDCIMSKCEYFQTGKAAFYNARKQMANSDVIITNHALYLADLVSGGNILPEHEVVIFDEAHNLYTTAVNAFTLTIGRYSVTKLLQKIQKRVSPVPDRYTQEIFDAEAKLLEHIFSFSRPQLKLNPDNNKKFTEIVADIAEILRYLGKWLETVAINEALFPDEMLQIKAGFHRQNLIKQLDNLVRKWDFLANPDSYTDRVNWVDINYDRGYFEIKSAPLFIDTLLEEKLWSSKSAVLTSATITVKNNFSYFKAQLGLDDASELILPSPFDYASQAALYIPGDIKDPNSDDYLQSCKKHIKEILEVTNGRAFLLFSSWRNMEAAYEILQKEITFPKRKQGDMTRKKLIEWFKDTPNSVLFATATFWEGVDIPGDDLSCVIIDKLPFSVPDDPLIQAKVDYMKANEMNWFNDFMLPEAIIKLRQGVGRLIRTRSDKGILAILDNRILTKSYGRTVLASLPPVTRIRNIREAGKFFNPE